MQTEELKKFYEQKALEHEAEARYYRMESWYHLAAVQDRLAAEWRAKIT